MSAFHARSVWKFIELVPLFCLPLVRGVEMCFEWFGVIHWRLWSASIPKLGRMKLLEGLLEADPSGRTVRRLWSYPELGRMKLLKGLLEADPSGRTVRRRNFSPYPELGRLKITRRPIRGGPIRKDGQAAEFLAVFRARQIEMLEGIQNRQIEISGRGSEKCSS